MILPGFHSTRILRVCDSFSLPLLPPSDGMLVYPETVLLGFPNSSPVHLCCLAQENDTIIPVFVRAWTTEDSNTLTHGPLERLFKKSMDLKLTYHLSSFCHFLDISYNFFFLLLHLAAFSIKISEKRPSE